jgi:hypothetical protein
MGDNESREWLFYASEDLAYGKLGMADLPRAPAWSFLGPPLLDVIGLLVKRAVFY